MEVSSRIVAHYSYSARCGTFHVQCVSEHQKLPFQDELGQTSCLLLQCHLICSGLVETVQTGCLPKRGTLQHFCEYCVLYRAVIRWHPGVNVCDVLFRHFAVPTSSHQTAHFMTNSTVFTGTTDLVC